jgi:HEAT repeat protein
VRRAFTVALSAGVLAGALSSSAAWLAAQAPPAVDATRVRDLLVLMAAPDQQGALDAATELQRMGPAVAPALVEALKKNRTCRVQWMASGVLHRLQLEPALVETTLVEMARGACPAASVADLNLQQDAALAIIDRPRGIALMTELLRSKDDLTRRRAVFAFDQLTERLRPGHPRTIAATPEILAATEASLTPLRDTAVSKAPPAIRCLAFEAIDQARSLPQAALASRATSLLQGAQVDCGSPPRTTKEGGESTNPVRRERTEEIIARLDRQPPDLAARTSSVLLAAPEAEVVPLLRKRLRDTNTCRGLALVAGVLAARHVAEADVEGALIRVAAGKCDGREPFDLTLAQNAANAFITGPDGITRLTGWLGDRDVAVRRRAARALATLFDRLGMGEASRPGADAAMLAAARAALPALVTLAQTDRDEAARCQAVRAIQRAQEARDDGLRAEAVAQSQGRTLRCQAPPGP